MMRPYYDHGGIIIYHADNRDVLPHLARAAAIVTDPPYNVGKDYGTHNDSMTPEQYAEWCKEIMSLCLPLSENQFWVAPRYKMALWLSLLPDAHLIVIPRGACGPFRQGWSDQFETALAVGKPNKCFPDLWNGIRLKGEGYFFREETFDHPGYTPSPIMQRAVELFSNQGDTIIEPFCGTGTTLRTGQGFGAKGDWN